SSPPQWPLPHGPPSAPPQRSSKRPPLVREAQNSSRSVNQTLSDIASQPSPLPGSSTRTDNLSVIPMFSEEKKVDKKYKDKKDKDNGEQPTGKKSSWGWLLGSEEKDKDKDSHKDPSKKSKLKGVKTTDKSYDNTRLDLL